MRVHPCSLISQEAVPRIGQFMRLVHLSEEFLPGPSRLSDRRKVQTVVMAECHLIVVQVMEPLRIHTEAPVIQRVYPDMPSAIIVFRPGCECGLRFLGVF